MPIAPEAHAKSGCLRPDDAPSTSAFILAGTLCRVCRAGGRGHVTARRLINHLNRVGDGGTSHGDVTPNQSRPRCAQVSYGPTFRHRAHVFPSLRAAETFDAEPLVEGLCELCQRSRNGASHEHFELLLAGVT